MKESTLLKIALISSLIGLVILYFVSIRITAEDYKPSKLTANIGEKVKLEGKVIKITDKGDLTVIEVSQQYPISIILFTSDNNLKLKEGDKIQVIGKVDEYNGKEEIIAEKILKLGDK